MSKVNNEMLKNLADELVHNKAYLGTTKSDYFPKVTSKFVLWEKNKQFVIDPISIANSLLISKEEVNKFKASSKNLVIVFDKELFKDEIEKICESAWVMYLNTKVPSWFFTNFETFSKRIYSMNMLRKFIDSTEFVKLTKKEQLMKKRELEKLENIYKWVKNLTKLPDLVIVVDAEYNLWVIDELEKVNIPYIAIANTNLSRWLLTDKLIVANTNSYESVIYILNYLLK